MCNLSRLLLSENLKLTHQTEQVQKLVHTACLSCKSLSYVASVVNVTAAASLVHTKQQESCVFSFLAGTQREFSSELFSAPVPPFSFCLHMLLLIQYIPIWLTLVYVRVKALQTLDLPHPPADLRGSLSDKVLTLWNLMITDDFISALNVFWWCGKSQTVTLSCH